MRTVYITVVALLAGLGTAWLFRHVSPRARRLVAAGLLVALALDYLAPTPRYDWIATYARPVDAVFRTMPDEVAIVEWPLNSPGVDVDAMLRTVGHRQRVVNGFAGFVPDFQRELSGLLAETRPRFASSEARTALSRIYPIRYLLVRDAARGREDVGHELWREQRSRGPQGPGLGREQPLRGDLPECPQVRGGEVEEQPAQVVRGRPAEAGQRPERRLPRPD